MKFSEYLKTSDFRSKQQKRGWKLRRKRNGGGVVDSKDSSGDD